MTSKWRNEKMCISYQRQYQRMAAASNINSDMKEIIIGNVA